MVISLHAWLDERMADAPGALRARIGDVILAHPEWSSLPRAEALLAAGELLLGGVLAAVSTDRTAALDLLAADACATHAFEAAAEEPSEFTELTERAMRRIAQLADES